MYLKKIVTLDKVLAAIDMSKDELLEDFSLIVPAVKVRHSRIKLKKHDIHSNGHSYMCVKTMNDVDYRIKIYMCERQKETVYFVTATSSSKPLEPLTLTGKFINSLVSYLSLIHI